jgi:hypothetical protein
MTTVIRPERPEDAAAIAHVNRLAFGGENEARLVAVIREAWTASAVWFGIRRRSTTCNTDWPISVCAFRIGQPSWFAGP